MTCHAETVEACARVAENEADSNYDSHSRTCREVAAAIRALPTTTANATRLTAAVVLKVIEDESDVLLDTAACERIAINLNARLASTPAPGATVEEALRLAVNLVDVMGRYSDVRLRHDAWAALRDALIPLRAALAVSRAPVQL